MKRVLVTGSNGFVGRAVVARLLNQGASVLSATRLRRGAGTSPAEAVTLSADDSLEQLVSKLEEVDVVVHSAALVHDRQGKTDEQEIFRVNRDWTERLAKAAERAGVSQFLFVSTIKVNGDQTPDGGAFDECSPVAPEGPYAQSKRAAEILLEETAARGRLRVCILRPPLIYGPGVRANFRSLVRAVELGLPLPFARVRNARSFVFVENFADLITRVVFADSPPVFRLLLVSDGEDVSTADLVRRIAVALGRSPRLLPVPVSWLSVGARLAGLGPQAQRLLGSLRVDSRNSRLDLSWVPPYDLDTGLSRTVGALSSVRSAG